MMDENRDWDECPKCGAKGKEHHEATDRLDDGAEAEYTAYCSECGEYLYYFCYGHREY